MKVVIIGAGEVGTHIAQLLSEAGKDVSIVDSDEERVASIDGSLDALAIHGHGTDLAVLKAAGAGSADLVLCVSNSDEVNIVSALMAKRMGAKRTIVRARKSHYHDENLAAYADAFDIDRIVCPEVYTAMEIARIVENPGSLEVAFFARGRIQMRRLVAEPDTRGVSIKLSGLKLPEGTLVASIGRDGEVLIPRGDDDVRPGDTVTVIGATEAIGSIHEMFHAAPEPIKRVGIGGGGLVGFTLARILGRRGFKVLVADRDRKRCNDLAETLPRAEVLHGDVTRSEFLKESGLASSDAYVAATNNDETNLMSALLVKQLGVDEIAVLVHRPDFAPLLTASGIATALSPRFVMANAVMALLESDLVSSIQLIEEGRAEILEIKLSPGSRASGRKLRDLGMPRGSLVAAVVRHGDVTVPRGDTELAALDTVVVFAVSTVVPEVEKILSSSPGG